MKRSMIALSSFVLFALIALTSTLKAEQIAANTLTPQQVRSLTMNAKTPADHMRLADYYGARADADVFEASQHQKMALDFSASSLASSTKYATGTVDHCVTMVRELKKHAAKMRKLQQEQEKLALQAGM